MLYKAHGLDGGARKQRISCGRMLSVDPKPKIQLEKPEVFHFPEKARGTIGFMMLHGA